MPLHPTASGIGPELHSAIRHVDTAVTGIAERTGTAEEKETDMPKTSRAFFYLTDLPYRWGRSLPEITGGTLAGRLNLLVPIAPVQCGIERTSGIARLRAKDVARLFQPRSNPVSALPPVNAVVHNERATARTIDPDCEARDVAVEYLVVAPHFWRCTANCFLVYFQFCRHLISLVEVAIRRRFAPLSSSTTPSAPEFRNKPTKEGMGLFRKARNRDERVPLGKRAYPGLAGLL